MAADMTFVQQSACRLMRALFEIALKRNWASLALKTLMICKMVEKRTWSSQSPLRQFPSIPELIVRKLEKNSDLVWERYHDLTPQDLGEMVKIPKMGKTLHKYVHMFPKLVLTANVQPITRSMLRIDLTITPDFQYDFQIHGSGQTFWIVVTDGDGEKIVHHEPFLLKIQHAKNEHSVNFSVQLFEPLPPQYFIHILSDRWLHSEHVLPVSFRHMILPQKFSPPTELLDLQPLPVSAVANSKFEALFESFRYFNPIQTQTFSALYEGDDNVLVCAPTGSGKSVCADFAILRLLSSNSAAKCVYIAPKEVSIDVTLQIIFTTFSHSITQDIALRTFKVWSERYDEGLGLCVVKLTGESSVDFALLDSCNLAIATAAQWDAISRRWKQRKVVQNISLYIVDELHLIGGTEGPMIEVVLSRVRFMASQLDKRIRIVGLSSSLANAKDVGDWIGALSHHIFNFPPDIRPVPVDIHVHGFEASHFGTRFLSMSKAAYHTVVANSPDKRALVFVPSRKHVHLCVIDFITYASTGTHSGGFLGPAGLSVSLEGLVDPTLRQALNLGIAFTYPGMAASDKLLSEALYLKGHATVLIMPSEQCWSTPVPANLVVVMDTVLYEGREHRYVNYPITDLLQMVGLASRPQQDQAGRCVIFCQSTKKEYLKKLLNDPLPVESHLDQGLHENICAEIVAKTIENKQEAVDFLTWTFFYKRLAQNPNYYGMQGASHRHVSDFLSELVENTISDLEESKCVAVEDDMDLSPLNLGMIASYYYVQYTTVELFASSLSSKSKLKGLIEILSSSSEFSRLPIRHSEEEQLKNVSLHLPLSLPGESNFDDPSVKANILLQSYFSRKSMSIDFSVDLDIILKVSIKLLQALVDVVSSLGWLRPALAAMELCQMIVQGLWDKDSVLLQIPHFTHQTVTRCNSFSPPVESIFDLIDLGDSDRSELLQMSQSQMSDVAFFCNAYPNLDISFEVEKLQVTIIAKNNVFKNLTNFT